jgi:catechol 2,3-dioxygenase-like lactoylglutathione lyase family enzyme
MTTQLISIAIIVRDMSATLQFYRTLGLPIDEGKDNESTVSCELPTGITVNFMKESAARFGDAYYDCHAPVAINLQFLCKTPLEVDTTHKELICSGFLSHSEPWDTFWGQRLARVEDPNGNVVNLFSPLINLH